MKPGRISVIAAAGIMAAGALVGITGAGPASASSTYSHLCVNGPSGIGTQCLDSELGTGQWVMTLPYGTASLTNWTYPTSPTSPATAIRQADNVNYCLQVDETAPLSQPADFEVIGANCVGDTAEMWWNHYDATAHRTLFESVWAYNNLNEKLCLTYNDSVGGVFVTPCNFTGGSSYWDQQWGTS